jgi:recombination protein RecA
MAKKDKVIDASKAINKLKDAVADNLIKDINKGLGNIAYSLGEHESPNNIKDFISSGSTLLDTLMTNGQVYPKNGFPVGRLNLVAGDSSSGKSLLAAHVLINTQKMGGIPIIFDEESTIDLALLKRMGLKIGQEATDAGYEKPVYMQAGTVEKVFEAMEKVIVTIKETDTKKLITIVWDSIASTPTNVEIEDDNFELAGYGMEKAKLMSKATRKLTQLISTHNVLLLWTNQIRVNIGAVGWGDKTCVNPYTSKIKIKRDLYSITFEENGKVKTKNFTNYEYKQLLKNINNS